MHWMDGGLPLGQPRPARWASASSHRTAHCHSGGTWGRFSQAVCSCASVCSTSSTPPCKNLGRGAGRVERRRRPVSGRACLPACQPAVSAASLFWQQCRSIRQACQRRPQGVPPTPLQTPASLVVRSHVHVAVPAQRNQHHLGLARLPARRAPRIQLRQPRAYSRASTPAAAPARWTARAGASRAGQCPGRTRPNPAPPTCSGWLPARLRRWRAMTRAPAGCPPSAQT